MGSGKSTVGKRLANRLHMPFVDTDNEVEARMGMSIKDIFEQRGEAYFREQEEEVIGDILAGRPSVIATGGGSFINPQIRENIKKIAVSVWLKADIEVLVERVSRSDRRPLLAGVDKREILAKLIEQRYPVYEEANITVDANGEDHLAVVNHIVRALEYTND